MRVAVRQKPPRFIDDQDVVIFICDLELSFRCLFSAVSRQLFCLFFRYVNAQLVARAEHSVFLCTFSVQLDIFSYQLVDKTQRRFSEILPEKTVKSLARFIFSNNQFHHVYDYTTTPHLNTIFCTNYYK